MNEYHYFVSYQYATSDNNKGFAHINLLLVEPLDQADRIEDVRQYLKENFPYDDVVILNFILLDQQEA